MDLHGQHAHQALAGAGRAARICSTSSAAFATLAREVGDAWRAWRDAVERRDAAASVEQASAAERETLVARRRELDGARCRTVRMDRVVGGATRLANAAGLIAATTDAENALVEGDDALGATTRPHRAAA